MTNKDSFGTTKPVHHGRNIKRFREMLGLKQDALAARLGPEWTQKKISQLEAMEKVELNLITQLAAILKVTPETIENFTEETANQYFQSFNDNSASPATFQYNCHFSALDKYVEMVDKNEKLYDALLKEKQEKINLLEQLLETKSK